MCGNNHFNLRRRFLSTAPYTTFDYNSKNKTHYISATSNNMPNSLFSGVGRFNRSSFLAVHFVLVLIAVVLVGIIATIVDEGGSDWAVFLFMLFFIPLQVLQLSYNRKWCMEQLKESGVSG